MGDSIMIGDFGRILFYVGKRDYYNDKEGKLRYRTVKEPFNYEGVEITDADKSRIWIEGIDKDIPDEVFNIRRSQVISFERMERPVIEVKVKVEVEQ